MQVSSEVTPEQAIQANLDTYCLEVGSEYERNSKRAVDLLMRYTAPCRIIDLGCGDGAATRYLVEQGFSVLAIDINQKKLDALPSFVVRIRNDALSQLRKFPSDYAPAIFCHHMLEHLPNPWELLAEISRVLNPGGVALIAVPAKDRLYSVHFSAFDNPDEIIPPNCEALFWESTWQHMVICKKR